MLIKLKKNQSTLPTEKLQDDLSSLEIVSEGLTKLPGKIFELDLHTLSLNTPGLEQRTFEFHRLKNLKTLKIRGASLRDRVISFPTNLQKLCLQDTQLEEVPDLSNLKNLQEIYLTKNKLKTFEKM